MFERALGFLANPCNLWKSERPEDKKTTLRLAFSDRLRYARNEGFRTPKTSLIFKALEEIGTGNFRMAESEVFTSNLIFDTFADWEHQLKHLEESRQRISGDKPDGPKP